MLKDEAEVFGELHRYRTNFIIANDNTFDVEAVYGVAA